MHSHPLNADIKRNGMALHRHEGEGTYWLYGFNYRDSLLQRHRPDPANELVAIHQ